MENQAGKIRVCGLGWQPAPNRPPVLTNLSFCLEPGHVYGIIGPNGSGKTSLLRHLLRLLDSEGAVELNGKRLEEWRQKALARELSYVPQNTAVDADFTVEEIVLMGRAPYLKRFESPGRRDMEIAQEAMRLTNCEGLREKSVLALSGGEVQRVVTARAIAQDAKWIFLDEPVSHLDMKHQLELMEIMGKLCREKGVTVVAVLHDINLALGYCGRLLCMKEGKLFCEGETAQVATRENLEEIYGLRFEEVEGNGRRYLIPGLLKG